MQICSLIRRTIRERGIDKNSLWSNRQRRCRVQPNMAINAGAFVEPTFKLRRVNAHGDSVPATETDDVSDVFAERIVAALVVAHKPAVDPDFRAAVNAVEGQPDSFARVAAG